MALTPLVSAHCLNQWIYKCWGLLDWHFHVIICIKYLKFIVVCVAKELSSDHVRVSFDDLIVIPTPVAEAITAAGGNVSNHVDLTKDNGKMEFKFYD